VNDPADEPPVLKIRRDAEKDVRYHYNRDERLALKGPLRQQGRSGCLGRIFRTGGRSLLPALLVVLAVVLVVLIVRLVSRDRAAVATEATVRFSTSAAGAGSVVIEALGSGETVARGRLPYTGTERQVDAEVTIGDGAVRLAADLGKP
jgi:hypothetical protein